MSRTTKVRIPVRVAHDGSWVAYGFSPNVIGARFEMVSRILLGCDGRVSYIVADVELPPEPDEVRGHVAAEPEAVDGEVLP